MSKEEFVDFLKSKGIEARLEDGVVMVLYNGSNISPTAVYRQFNLAKKFAEENGYNSSLGIRKKGGTVHVTREDDSEQEKIQMQIPEQEKEPDRAEQPNTDVCVETYEQMELF